MNSKPIQIPLVFLRIKLEQKEQITMFWFMDGELMKREISTGLEETLGVQFGVQTAISKSSRELII
jgi:hypothetical protein